MKVIMLEGTPEEIKKVAHLFVETPLEGTSNGSAAQAVIEPTIEPVEAIRRMLTRRPISNGQMAVYKALAGGRLEWYEYLNQADRTSAQIAGIHGALGRRINNTPEIHQAIEQ